MNQPYLDAKSIWGWVFIAILMTFATIWAPASVRASSPTDMPGKESRGLIEKMPEVGLFGIWLIDGKQYETTRATKFSQNEGPLAVDACVKVKYASANEPHRITKIETQETEECESESDKDKHNDDYDDDDDKDKHDHGDDKDEHKDKDDDDKDNHDDDKDKHDDDDDDEDDDKIDQEDFRSGTALLPTIETHGIVSVLPNNDRLEGTWTIDGVDYTADEHTKFDADHGDFTKGICVEVKYAIIENEGRFARKIETDRTYKCAKDEAERAHGVLFGVIQDMPEEKTGEWNIGGFTFLTDIHTKFKTKKHVPFAEGTIVKVKFYVMDGRTHYAYTVETKFRHGPPHRDDDKVDEDEIEEIRQKGHAFGPIETMPDGLIGQWIIGGVPYSATVGTSYIQDKLAFAQGVQVRVNYELDNEENRIATVIKSSPSKGNGNSKFVGFLKDRPAGGFQGEWVLDNVSALVDLSTVIDESLGLIAEKAYLEVDYIVVDGKLKIQRIKVHVPPGAGDNEEVGAVERIDSEVSAASVDANETWIIDGKTYTVTPATEINEDQGALGVGSQIYINSYTAGDGSEIATQISGTSLNNTLFLPLTQG